MRRFLFRIYWAMQKALVPRLRHSQEVYRGSIEKRLDPDTVWLDLGCGRSVLRVYDPPGDERALIESCRTVVGLDRVLSQLKGHRSIALRVQADMSHLPFKTDSFDLVTANMVIEHLHHPEAQFAEINRILRPGGVFLFHTMNTRGYLTFLSRLVPEGLKTKVVRLVHGRADHDIFPTYYKANEDSKIRDIARKTNFEVERIRMIVSTAEFVVFLPLALIELIWIRFLMLDSMKPFRTNIIGAVRKP